MHWADPSDTGTEEFFVFIYDYGAGFRPLYGDGLGFIPAYHDLLSMRLLMRRNSESEWMLTRLALRRYLL